MDKKRLKVGIIGCGGIANGKHMPSIKAVNMADMVAFCDLIEERAVKAAKEYGVPGAKVYTDYKELLADPEIDVVHVCTPNRSHADISIDAMHAGKHVMCEKPMAKSAADARRMVAAAKETGKKLTIGYQHRHKAEAQYVKKVIERGDLGDMYYAEAFAVRRRGTPNWGVFLNEYEQGGGPLIDIGTHALDLTLFLMNNYDVDYVCGTSFEKLGHTLDAKHQGQVNYRGEFDTWNNETYDVEDSAVGFIKMKNGATIVLRAAWAINMAEDYAANGEAYTMLAGTEGGLDTKEGRVRLNHVVAEYPTISWVGNKVRGFIPGFSQGPAPKSKEAEIWVKALKGEGELFVTADQAYVVTRILDAIYESNRTGKPVYFD